MLFPAIDNVHTPAELEKQQPVLSVVLRTQKNDLLQS